MGELHLEVLVDRMRREFKVEARNWFSAGLLPGDFHHTRSAAKAGSSARAAATASTATSGWEIEPTERGSGIVFENAIAGGVIPREYVPAVEAGVRQALDNGPLGGYPLVDLKIRLG